MFVLWETISNIYYTYLTIGQHASESMFKSIIETKAEYYGTPLHASHANLAAHFARETRFFS